MLIYDPDRAQRFARAGWQQRAQLQSAVRLEVKLDFIAGLVHKALLTTGSIEFRGVQAGLGEIIAYRNLIAGIRAGMIEGATPGPGGSVEPNSRYARSYSAVAPGIYRRVREIVETVVASGLIYLNSHAVDFETPEMRPYLDQFMRGTDGIPAIDRSRTMKLLWDAIGSEFGARHELYELNYFGQPEAHHLASLAVAKADGTMAGMECLVEECMSEYDTKGWTAGDMASPDDVSVITRAG
ncbi:MAG TPA: 4-hydroxyphenylacetate 3-hydroxylase C-terminal domain-containing protein [Microlunatus sp.]